MFVTSRAEAKHYAYTSGQRLVTPDVAKIDPAMPEARLWLGVLRQALKDFDHPDLKIRCEAEDFVLSRRSTPLFLMLGLRRGLARDEIRRRRHEILAAMDDRGVVFNDCKPAALQYRHGKQIGRKRGHPSQFGVAA